MDKDHDFKVRAGRIRTPRGRVTPGRAYTNQVLKAANMARGGKAVGSGSGRSPSQFTGSRIGRGTGAGAVLASRSGVSQFRQRRVMVKARIVKFAGKGRGAAVAHLRYVQRDGVTRDGRAGELYCADKDQVDGREFLGRSEGDRHQFRFIVSPEDGAQYDDLKDLTRRLMSRMEDDLGTKLDWVAVDHFNTGHPHTHILLRGRDDQDKDLIIARNYITDGIRERAAEIISLDLGPRSEHEISRSLQAEMTQDRFTTIDRWLVERQNGDGVVLAVDTDSQRQSLLAGRLNHLQDLGLAAPARGGQWVLDDSLEPTLRALGRRGDIINSLSYDLGQSGQGHLLHDAVVHDAALSHMIDHSGGTVEPIIGQLIRRGLFDEAEDRDYVLVDATDGRMHVIDIGDGARIPFIPEGAVISIAPRDIGIRQSDETIARVASLNDGLYSIDRHLATDPSATEAFANTHVRRLEAVRRATGQIERLDDGTFHVGDHYLTAADTYEQMQTERTPVKIEILSPEPPQRQVRMHAFTWLDQELTNEDFAPLSPNGFGRTVSDALGRRQQWLIEEGLASKHSDGSVWLRVDLKEELLAREMKDEGRRLSQELGKSMGEVVPFERIDGQLHGKANLASGSFAVVERSRDFVLVPWRDVLEHHIGEHISGFQHEHGIDWSIGRSRDLGIGM